MMEVVQIVLAIGWLGLIILGLMPDWGARFGLWLTRGGGRPAPTPPPNRSLGNRHSGDPRANPTDEDGWEAAEGESHVGQNLDRFV